jgi:pyruvate carboxylase subunit B
VAVGDTVAADEGLVVLEAMKMENELCAPAAGVVHALHAAPGDAVDKDTLLVELDLATDDDDATGPSDDA